MLSSTATWDGQPGWPRPRGVSLARAGASRLVPSCFVQADPADPLSADPARLRECFAQLLCQVCGEPVLEVDRTGWVLEPAANMGGACCTRCTYLAVRTCPHLAGAPAGDFAFVPVTAPTDYTWVVREGTASGHVQAASPDLERLDWAGFIEHYRAWKTARPATAR